jgi:hypothetical protein
VHCAKSNSTIKTRIFRDYGVAEAPPTEMRSRLPEVRAKTTDRAQSELLLGALIKEAL